MQRTLVMLGWLAVTASLLGAGSGRVLAGSTGESLDGPWPVLVPLERLLIAVLDVGVNASPSPEPSAVDQSSDGVFASHLHLADPAATVIVLESGEAQRTVGPLTVGITAPTAIPTALRVETTAGGAVTIELPDAAPGHVTVVEVLGGPDGIVAQRVGDLQPVLDELRVPTWQPPAQGADAVALDGAWWSLRPDVLAPDTSLSASAAQELRRRVVRNPVSRLRRLVDASVGDVTGDGAPDLALSFRRPFRRTLLNASSPRRDWTDARGQSAHVGLFRPTDLSSIWVAGTLARPVRRLAACTGALAIAYSTLRRPEIVATTSWEWQGFGFLPLPELPGAGRPTCIDIDQDGRPDAVIVERS